LGYKGKKETKYMLMPHHMDARKYHNIKAVDTCFDNSGMTVINHNMIYE
jgi:hypothetical protein